MSLKCCLNCSPGIAAQSKVKECTTALCKYRYWSCTKEINNKTKTFVSVSLKTSLGIYLSRKLPCDSNALHITWGCYSSFLGPNFKNSIKSMDWAL